MIKINLKEIENVVKLDSSNRYKYFIKKVADSSLIWGLYDKGWALVGDKENIYMPVWPLKEFARLCINNDWKSYKARPIDLHFFVEHMLDDLDMDDTAISVFLTNDNKAICVNKNKLKNDLYSEMSLYE